ncbi:DUF817 domain-containing protein [Cellulomonas persica]|uniref:DUF817 domain-containing protein n=1 Tax=Cellulomonas persica TaxID=76861 RepID=A0A510USX4_9CELL|nr:hypothetical protein CPE01_14760 [Cellulomonas persica]
MLLAHRLVRPLSHARSAVERGLTSVEQRIDAWAHRRLARLPTTGPRAWLVELVVFTLKQAWACLFGALLLAAILAARLWYPDDAPLARNDALTLVAVALQVLMLVTRLETVREMRVVLLFHVVGTVMEVFKTDVGSWSYAADGMLRVGAVPLFSGFMYGAVGSYLARVMRIFDLRFDRYPRRWLTAVVAVAIYANFFTHHWWWDARWLLVAAVVVVYGRCVMHVRVLTQVRRMPVLVAFLLVSSVIWVAENVATFAGAWLYPAQAAGWHLVSPHKLVAWFLLMLISVVLVAWVHVPRPPDEQARDVGRQVPDRRERRTDHSTATTPATSTANSAPTTNVAGPPLRGPGSIVGSADGVDSGVG